MKNVEVTLMKALSRIAALALLTGLLVIPTAQARTRVYLQIGPPAVIVEQRQPAPYPYYAWQPGYHAGVDGNYVWVRGAWVRPPHRHAVWVTGRWAHEHRGY